MECYVEESGGGRSVIFTHGLGSDGTTWDALRAELDARGEQVAATVWDLPGHGRSARSTDSTDPADYSSALAFGALRDLVAPVAPAVLVGHSFGGYLSLALAEEAPDLVHALVLVAAGPGFRDPEARRKWNEMTLAGSERLGLPEPVLHLGLQHDSNVVDRLGSVTCPVLVIVGERDRRFHAAASLFERKLGATVVIVPGAGHNVHETHAPEIAPTLHRFLASTSGGWPILAG